MSHTWMKWALPVLILTTGFGTMALIKATAGTPEPKELVDDRPTVPVVKAHAIDHTVSIHSFGEVRPLESTQLSAQVSGEVTHWNANFTPGGLVQKGEVLFSIEKDNYEAALLQAEARLSRAQASLIEEKAKAQVAEQEAKRLSKKVSDLYLRKPQVMSAQAEVKSAQAALQLARKDLADCDVKAPYDALVVSRQLGVGQYINAGAKVAVLNSVEAAEVVFPVPRFDDEFLPESVVGITASITYKNSTRPASIARDSGTVDNATRMGHLIAKIEDPYSLKSSHPQLKFGSYVAIQFNGKTLKNVYKVPQDVVNHSQLWLVNSENKLEPRKVTVAREEGAFFYISQGLNEQDVLVLTPPDYPQAGQEVITSSDDTKLAQR